jgi:hypothetical protein
VSSFAEQIERLFDVVLAAVPLERELRESERLDWGQILEQTAQMWPSPYPGRKRPCPHCVSGRLGPARPITADAQVMGHHFGMAHPRARDMTPEQHKRGESSVPGAFVCACPSHGPFTLHSIERDHARGWL